MEFFPKPLTEEESYSMGRRIKSIIAERGWGLWAVEVPVKVSFAQDILKSNIEKYRSVAVGEQATFFDRWVLDALYMLDAENALSRADIANYVQLFPYNPVVFLLPPWEDIYGTDSERDQTFEESLKVFERMKSWYSQWDYKTLDATSIHQASVA